MTEVQCPRRRGCCLQIGGKVLPALKCVLSRAHMQGNCVPVINTFGGFDNEKCTVSVDRAKKIIR